MDSHRPPSSDPEAENDRSRSTGWIALAIPLILGLAVLVWIAVLA
jgi:hypothetical protein